MSDTVKILQLGETLRINEGTFEEYRELTQEERDNISPRWAQQYDKKAKIVAMIALMFAATAYVAPIFIKVERSLPLSIGTLIGFCIGYHGFARDGAYHQRSWLPPVNEPDIQLSPKTEQTLKSLVVSDLN